MFVMENNYTKIDQSLIFKLPQRNILYTKPQRIFYTTLHKTTRIIDSVFDNSKRLKAIPNTYRYMIVAGIAWLICFSFLLCRLCFAFNGHKSCYKLCCYACCCYCFGFCKEKKEVAEKEKEKET